MLTGAEVRREPFPHFVAGHAIEPELAEAALAWLRDQARWHLHREAFFEQYELDLRRAELPRECAALTDDGWLSSVRARVSALMGCDLAEAVTVGAHKLVAGQGIGLHNDMPCGGRETHRVVVHLGNGFEDRLGGHLVFFASDDPGDVHRVFRPLHNSAVGFEASGRSHHAVSDVHAGERYSLILGFWEADDFDRGGQRGELGRLVRVLRRLGAHDAGHSGGRLVEHLIGTHELLGRWGYPPAVQRAGLFHSVYGTATFHTALVAPGERHVVRDAIGPKAERLVHLYATRDRPPTPELLALDAANAVEQHRRIRRPSHELCEELVRFEREAGSLPEAALADIRAIYERTPTPG